MVQATHRAFEEAYGHRVVPEIERVDGLHGVFLAAVERTQEANTERLRDFGAVHRERFP